jgi:putative redox protein
MGEKVIVRQNSDFGTLILAADPHDPESDHLHPVEGLHQLTPYGMLLSSLGSCTAIVMHTYAQHHHVHLDEVELRLEYGRVFKDDCEDCEGIDEYEERIEEEIVLMGDLSPQDRKRLFAVSKQCPIHKMVQRGIEIRSQLADESTSVGAE